MPVYEHIVLRSIIINLEKQLILKVLPLNHFKAYMKIPQKMALTQLLSFNYLNKPNFTYITASVLLIV